MNKVIFLFSILFFSCKVTTHAQDHSPQSDLENFIVIYKLGDNWDTSKSPQEQVHFKEHSAFLSNLRKEKSIVLGARYAETGMIILLAKDVEEANEIIRSDVATQNDLFKVEIHPLSPFYKGCID